MRLAWLLASALLPFVTMTPAVNANAEDAADTSVYVVSYIDAAPATLIVQNAGLVMTPGIDQAFASIYDHRTVGRVRERGGIVVQMPRLICMNEVTKRRLGFVEAYEGKKGADGTAVAFLDRVRIRNWWTKEVPGALFAEVPTTWFPGFPETAAATE